MGETFIAGSERFLEAIEPQKRVGVIMQCFLMVGIDHECGFELLQRLLGLFQTKQRQSEIVQRIEPPRLKRKRRPKACACLLKPQESEQSVALVIERVGVIGPYGNCAFAVLESLCPTSKCIERDAAVVERLGVIGQELQRRVISGERFLVPL